MVGNSGHQYITQPDRSSSCCQTTSEVQDGLDGCTSEIPMPFRIPALDVQKHQIYILQFRIGQPCPEASIRIERGVDTECVRSREQLNREAVLHQGLAAAQRETAPH